MQSLWLETSKDLHEPRPSLDKNIKTDVLVIGGGIAGVLCAYMLGKKGVPCILVGAKQIGSGVTQNTTAKITVQHGLIYQDLLKKFGHEQAQKYYAINKRAVDEFAALAETYPCDFERKSAFVYSLNNRQMLEVEAKAYGKLGIESRFDESPPLPFKTAGAVGVAEQAQFHPLKLLYAVSKQVEIYENTFVTAIEGNKAITKNGIIAAKNIILGTHFPLVNIPGFYFVKMYQHRSYVLALQNATQVGDMYVDERQNGHSFRNYNDLLLLGGGDHRTGQKGGGWQELRQLAKRAYPNAIERFAWATQDCMTLDSVPYIGIHRKSAQNLYVATGFNKWGMSGSMASAMVLSDLIALGKSEYADLFSPQRSMLHAQLFLNIAHATQGLLSFGKRCPHMGCALRFNPHERTWDCSCHGSRFSEDGHIVDNPAKRRITP